MCYCVSVLIKSTAGQQNTKKEHHAQRKASKAEVFTPQAGLTCKGSLVQVHSSTPEKTVKPQGFSRFFVFVAPESGEKKCQKVNKRSTTASKSPDLTVQRLKSGLFYFLRGCCSIKSLISVNSFISAAEMASYSPSSNR